jgi:hypothetical protein
MSQTVVKAWILSAVILFVPLASGAQELPRIRGHVIGETIIDYFSEIDGGLPYLATCRSMMARRQSKTIEFEAQKCRALVSAFDSGSRGQYTSLETGQDIAFFDRGQLVKMILRFEDERPISFEDVKGDVISRFGVPTGPDDFTKQIDTTSLQYAEWNCPELYLKLEEVESKKGHGPAIVLSVMTAEEYDKLTGRSVRHRDLLQ